MQGAITKRMKAIADIASMDVVCNDETCTLTLNKLTVDKTFVETFTLEVDEDTAVLYIARAFRVESGDAITVRIVGNLADPEEITEFCNLGPDEKNKAPAIKTSMPQIDINIAVDIQTAIYLNVTRFHVSSDEEY